MNSHAFLAIIPARAGSKRLRNKNLLKLLDIPLIGWTIKAALESKYIEKVFVTTDSEDILSYSNSFGLDNHYLRPAHLATDDADSFSVVKDAIRENASYQDIVLLQPTSPLRTSFDIDQAISMYLLKKSNNVVSINKIEEGSTKFQIYYDSSSQRISSKGKFFQSNSKYQLNGAIYIFNRDKILCTKSFIDDNSYGYLMPAERSVDIDTKEDFELAKHHLGYKIHQKL